MLQTIPFCRDIHYVILSLCRSDKNIIMSLIDPRGTVFHDNPIFHYFFTFVKKQLNLSLEEYFLRVFSLCMSRNMFLFYSYKAILKILSVCCAPTDPPKSPRPKFFFRYFRFLFFFSGFPRTPIVRRKQTSKASSDFQNNQCTPRF